MSAEPSRSLEVERKYDVTDDTPLPDWTALPHVAAVGAAEHRRLDARYLDDDGLTLAAAGVAVRRRTGGPDAGWHVKVSAPEGRHEYHWELGGDDDPVPEAVTETVSAYTTAPLHPLARIRNERTAYALLDGRGGLVAEFVDDRVSATAERTGHESEWREWEVELGPAAPAGAADRAALFAAVDALIADAGGRPAAADSKLQRSLDG